MPDYTDTTVNQLVFNVLASAKYQELQNNSQINADQLYLITDDSAGTSDIFVAEYGTTTYAEISTALNENKLLFCHVSWNNIVCPYIGVVNSQYAFSNLGAGESTVSLYVNSSNTWSYATSNLATKITASGILKGDGSGSVTAATAGTDYQAPLVSGTNIKTINNTSLLGSGNIDISGGGAVKGSFSFTGQGGDTVEGEAGILHLPDENDHTFSLGMSGFANEGDPDEEYNLTSDFKFQPDPADYEYGLHWYSDVPIVINGSAGMYLYSNSSGNEIATRGEIQSKANLASPTFTGTPKAPTAAAGTNTTQIATTAFVQAALDSNFIVITGTVSNTNQVTIQKTPTEIYNYLNAGTSVYVKALYEGDNPYYPESAVSIHRINSIKFEGNSGSQLYTIYVNSCPSYDSNSRAICEGYGAGNVSDSSITFSVKGVLYAPLASPNFTGNPTAPTQTAGNNSTRIATTAFVQGEKKNLVVDGDSSLDISSLADLKTQLSTWYATIEDCSTAFFWFHVPTAFSLLTQGDKLVRLQRATSTWGFAEIFADFGNSGPTQRMRYFSRSDIYMNLGSGTWFDPVLIRATLGNYYDYANRPTDADTAVPFVQCDGGLYSFKATDSMTSNKPVSDGHIIHDTWDYTGNYSTQLFLPNATTNGTSDNGNRHVQVRGCYNGTWKSWESLAWMSDVTDAINTAIGSAILASY